MAVYKESGRNTWRAVYRYTDWTGERKQTQKRGFKTKRDALAWEREQLVKKKKSLDMTFESFYACEEMKECIRFQYHMEPTDRLFPVTKAYLHHEMTRGAKAAGIKRIRIHDLRHSHISLLIDMLWLIR